MKSEVTVESLALYINRGITPKYTEVIDDSVIVLNQKCIRDFKVSLEPSRRNDLSKRKITEGKMLKKHDVLINSTGVGTLGRVAQYFGADDDATVDSHVTIVRPNPELVDPIYFGYLMKSKQSLIESFAEGTTGQTELNRNSVKELLLEIVNDIPTQKIIGGILLEIDQKLELNTQTNQTLEQIAQAIFKSWFVDFDPVKAKIETLAAGGNADDAELAAMGVISAKTLDELNSLKASNPEQFNKLAQTAALFPAAMQDSELGEIPEGWEVSDLASCTTELRRGISPKYIEEGGVLVINQKCIRNHTIDFSLARRNDSSKRKVDGREIVIGDVLVNSTGVGTLGRLAPIRFLNETTVADSHVTVVRANTTKISKSFLAGLMLTNEAYIEASGAGSTGQTELRKQVLEDIKFVKPLSAVDRLFDEIASNFNAQIAELEKQRVTLSLTRDALLPKLLSSELVGE
ncbi:restriction endonuclease subunit S [Vibrio cholerae]|nr:restriction endonuclease subunit S [Vibrio cholerae]